MSLAQVKRMLKITIIRCAFWRAYFDDKEQTGRERIVFFCV